MLNFSTENLRPQDRFDHWCEVRARNLFGVTISLEREKRLDFQGRFSAFGVGGAILSQMQASSYEVSRTAGDISRASSNSLCIYQQTSGASWFDDGAGGQFVVPASGIAISYSDLPYMTRPVTAQGFDLRILRVPLRDDMPFVERARDLPPAFIQEHPRLTMAISASFAALAADAAGRTEADFDSAVAHLAQLALLARNRVAAGTPEVRAALRFGFLHAARRILAGELHRPDLSSAMVASVLGISVRQVHVLFEPTGMSFSRTMTAMRLDKAFDLLQSGSPRSIADIAYACGFDSIATFYRVFRSAYGAPPGDFRKTFMN